MIRFKTGKPSMPLGDDEKLRRARAAMMAEPVAVAGKDGTRQTMRVAGLVLRFGLTDDDAWSLLCEYSARCEPPWDTEATTGANSLRRLFDSAAQRDGKAAGASSASPSLPRSSEARPVVPAVDALKVAERFAANVTATGQDWIAASAETAGRTDWRVVAKLFNPDECLSVVTDAVQSGEKWKPAGAGHVFTADYVTTKEQHLVLRGFNEAAGAWVRINPVKPGSRGAIDEDVASFRHVLLESDSLPIGLQIKVLWRLRKLGLPVALLIHSGGGSVHAWVKVDCPDADSYKATVARLFALPLGFDPKNKNPSRLSRWPNVKRGSGLQSCVFIDPNVNPLDEATLSRIEETVTGEGGAASPVVDAPAIESVPEASTGAAVENAGIASPSLEGAAKAVEVVDFSALDARRIRLECPPPVPVPVFKLAGQTICTAGNLAAIAAQAKSGKSATVGAMLSSLLCAGLDVQLYDEPDTLGFTAEPHQGQAVVLFDTEQSARDSWSLVRRAVDRAGVAALPDNVRAYRLLDVPTKERRAMLSAELERASVACGGVHVVLLDGVADLCIDPNDAEEAFGLVDELVQLAVRFDCPFVCVLHENPAQHGQGGKTRGHLGSQLERKAESNLRLEKDDAGVSVIYSTRCRNGDLPKSKGVTFAWSDELKMHITVERTVKECSNSKRATVEDLAGLLSLSESITKDELEMRAKDAGISDKRCRGLLASALEAGALYRLDVPRPGVRPQVKFSRVKQSAPSDDPY